MRVLREWILRLLGSLRSPRRDSDLEEELRLHLELAAEAGRRDGLSGAEALRAARLSVGGVSQAMDAFRDQRGLPWVDDLMRDVQHAFRGLRRSPGFTAVVLVTLGLGIGVNTAIFSIVHAVVLSPLAYPRPEQLVHVTAYYPMSATRSIHLSYPEYEELRAMSRSFAHLGAFTTGMGNTGGGSGVWTGEVNLTADGTALRVRSAGVDEHLLKALAVQPVRGRLFAPGETDALASRPGVGGPPLAILSHELWQSAFRGRALVGERIAVDGRPHEIIGIMPPGVDLMDTRPEIWLPLGVHPAIRQIRSSHLLSVIGRLNDGVTPDEAQAEVNGFLESWSERIGSSGHVPTHHPADAEDHTLRLEPLRDGVVGDASGVIWVLQAAVGLVLLIACANLANLVMARAESRRRELAVRTALGASRWRLLRQTLTEGLLLATGGGVLGVWLASTGVEALVRANPASLPRTSEIGVDSTVLLFALGLSIATGLLFGGLPVARRGFTDLITGLGESGVRGAHGAARGSVRRGLVIVEVALAVMLVVTAGLLLRTVYNLTRVDPGFDRSDLVTFSITLPRAISYPGGRAEVYRRLLENVRAIPGVQTATVMSDIPVSRSIQSYITQFEDPTAPGGRRRELVDYYQFVMSDYFQTLRIPITAGRAFSAADTQSQERVAIVSEGLARKLFPDGNPIGQRLRPNLSASMGAASNPWHTVIGVVRDIRQGAIDRQPGAELYLFSEQPAPSVESATGPWRPHAPPTMHVAMRTTLPAAALAETLRRLVRDLDPGVPVVRLRDMQSAFTDSIRRPRLLAQLLGGFALLALLLAAVGTYGVLAYMVTERRREIGIRMALGAARTDVIRLVLKQGLQPAIIGVVAGLSAALAVGRLIASMLFDVRPADLATLTLVAGAITIVAAAASWLPAWRASRLDPNTVLRAE